MKKLIAFLLILTIVFTLASCTTTTPPDGGNDDGNNNVKDNDVVDPAPENETVNIKLYFANREYIKTGDDDLDRVLVMEREVKPNGQPIEEIVIEELKNEPDEPEKVIYVTLMDKIEVLSVETKKDTAYVNISGENLHGSSLEESLILQQIVLSLTELDNVEQVQFLVDGEKRESLMGHIFIEEPLKREDIE